ncbi:MAG TPA: sigma-70 family RNA polymerase sigma factor [Candidatus Saccharimonadales bacterium]|nr:sigma-70 family RNA polymerase sigma factor [Candidatus Saccharimonadales bacterium]
MKAEYFVDNVLPLDVPEGLNSEIPLPVDAVPEAFSISQDAKEIVAGALVEPAPPAGPAIHLSAEPAEATGAAKRYHWENEAELQRAARLGDRAAFGTLAEYYRPILLGYAHSMYAGVDNGSFHHRAEDSVQEAILTVLSAVSQQEIASRPDPRLPYFFSAMRSEFLDWLKSAAHRRTTPAGDISTGLDVEEAEDYQRGLVGQTFRVVGEIAEDNIARSVAINEAHMALAAIWQALNERQREYARLRFVEELTLKEISELTEDRMTAVKAVFFRIFERARRMEADGRVERPDTARGELIGRINNTDKDGASG